MNKRMILLALVALLSACEADLGDYTCTEDEHSRVEHETLFCSENAGYRPSACYRMAVRRICKHFTARS